MSSINTLHIGRTGLKTASYGVEVAGQNVTNASTEGYVRRRLVSQTRVPHRTADGVYKGQGVTVAAVARDIDRFATERAFEAMGDESMASTASETLKIAEANFREGDTSSISDRLDKFFDSLTELTSEPSDHGLRSAARDSGQDLVDAVNRGGAALLDSIRRAEDRITDELNSVNKILDEIRVLNKRISDSDAINGPADLMDARDGLVETLAQKVGVDVDYKANGQISLFVGGHALVQDVHVRNFVTDTDPTTGRLSVQITVSGDAAITVDTFMSGEIGGLIAARDQSQSSLDSLDEFTEEFVDEINAQHSSGFDAYGSPGLDFFTLPGGFTNASTSMALDSVLATDINLIAAAGAPSAEVGDGDNLTNVIDVENTKLFGGGTQNSREFVASIYADLGNAIVGFEVDATTHGAIMSDLNSLKESTSKVDLDEEAVSLMQYQAAYQAAARVVTAADDLLNELMQTVR
ncbi:MAG: flagellar hook-associated protein FlgK [Myxococcota bacterium]|nr:flagellar hook-associated protein FlgK [Myxococcota bacterium]